MDKHIKKQIYWFTGQPGHGKTVLGKMLVKLFKEHGRPVFHVDGDHLRELTVNKDYSEQGRIDNIRRAQLIAEYLLKNDCDVVVSLVAPYEWLREEFKERIGKDNIKEFYVHCSEPRERDHFHSDDYVAPKKNFTDIDTTHDSPQVSFVKVAKAILGI